MKKNRDKKKIIMKKIQKHTLERLLATLRLSKTSMEYNNTYVFGFDDVERIIQNEIAAVSPLVESKQGSEWLGECEVDNRQDISRLHGIYMGNNGDGSVRCCDNGDFDEEHTCMKTNKQLQ